MELETFLQRAWKRYTGLAPDASKVVDLLHDRNDSMVNDHIAFRTFDLPGMNRLQVGRVFEGWGYKMADELLPFPEKKLLANYWVHDNTSLPKIFVSDLQLGLVHPDLQAWIWKLAKHRAPLTAESFLEPTWDPVRLEDYERFYPMSEYAAWTAAFGIQVNHFTLLVNSSKSFDSLHSLNDFLKEQGVVLNESGGLIKGTPTELLEQSSTMAREVEWTFAGGIKRAIPGCYFEFARRYPEAATNRLFTGFIPKSADRIFESTFQRPNLKTP